MTLSSSVRRGDGLRVEHRRAKLVRRRIQKEAIAEIDPALVENQLVFPDAETRARLHEYDAEALENVDFQQKWRAVIGQ